MAASSGGGTAPSYRNIVSGDTSQTESTQPPTAPVLGATWQAKMKGNCLPRAVKKPRLIIPENKLEEYRGYMKNHALICKFIGVWPSEKELMKWIQIKWQPKGHIDLKLGAKGFFTVIFSNLQDKERIFEGGPYFYSHAGLFLRQWEECYNPEQEQFLAAPVWVRLFGLPMDFWDPEILEGIGNSLGSFVKIVEATTRGRYTSFARICVYMNISEPLPDMIELEYAGKIWQQMLDYEHVPFRCRRCHEYGHLYKSCPLNSPLQQSLNVNKPEQNPRKDEEGFTLISNKKRPTRPVIPRPGQTSKQNPPGSILTGNKYEVLREEGDLVDQELTPEEQQVYQTETIPKTHSSKRKAGVEKEATEETTGHELTPMEVEQSKEDLSAEEKLMRRLLFEWRNLDDRFIPVEEKTLYKETFEHYISEQAKLETQAQPPGQKLPPPPKQAKKRGRPTVQESIQIVGEMLINTGKIIPLTTVFQQLPKNL
jgi:hypothetical protein